MWEVTSLLLIASLLHFLFPEDCIFLKADSVKYQPARGNGTMTKSSAFKTAIISGKRKHSERVMSKFSAEQNVCAGNKPAKTYLFCGLILLVISVFESVHYSINILNIVYIQTFIYTLRIFLFSILFQIFYLYCWYWLLCFFHFYRRLKYYRFIQDRKIYLLS